MRTTNTNAMDSCPTPPTKILVVEDEAGARDVLHLILKSQGYNVLAVEDGETCLSVYPEFQPDLVLLDALLPGINGFDCCRALRAQTDTPQAEIIMLTSLDHEQAVQEAVAAGASNYLVKPIRPAVLQQQIRCFIQQAETQRQLEVAQHTLQQQLQQRTTQLEQVLEKLQGAVAQTNEFEQLKANLLTYLSHNIRNPLNVIQTSSELLQRFSPQMDDRQTKHLQKIEASVDAITNVLQLLTTFDQLTSGAEEFYPTPVHLTQLCQNVVAHWQSHLTFRHSLVFSQQGSAQERISLDRMLIQQVLDELISNAIRYSPAGGEIRLQLHWFPDSLILKVEDEGLGVPEAEQVEVFKPFYRASNANKVPSTPGVGLGLAIVQQVVTLHQGTISLQSELNQGTTVVIRLPWHPIL